MGKKIVKIDGKTYVIDEKDLDPIEEEVVEEPVEEVVEEPVEPEVDESKLDEAADKVIEKLGIKELTSDIADLKSKFEEKSDKKVSALVDLEKLMNKSVDEMTSREKILGFFQALLRNDEKVLKALSEGLQKLSKKSVNCWKTLFRAISIQALA